MVKKSFAFWVDLEHFVSTEFQYFLQPWWRNRLSFDSDKIFFNQVEEIAYPLESIWSILEEQNFKIFFNLGEEITYLFESPCDFG